MINTNFIQRNFPKGKLSVVHGRPAVGKTSMAVSLAQALARDGHHPIYFSMEMSKEMLAKRFAAQMGAEVPTDVWANILINDTPSVKISDIRDAIDGLSVDFIIIDYLQLMTCEGCSSRTEEQVHIKNELKKFDHAYINELVKFNPTAENMAAHFGSLVLLQARKEGCDGVYEICCEVQESERNVASWVWINEESKSNFRKFRITFEDGSRCFMEACDREDAIKSFCDDAQQNIKTIIEEQ